MKISKKHNFIVYSQGFATLFEYYIPHLVFPTLGFNEDFRTAQIQMSLRNDVATNSASVPMSTYVEEPTAIRGRFNFISYGKAGTVLSMFQQALTADTFHKGLKYYLEDMYYKAAEPKDLFRGLQRAYNEDNFYGTLSISNVMSTWIFQAGYPLVSIERKGNEFVFRQERYPSGNGELYAVPITFATKQSPDFEKKTPKFWLRDFTYIIPESTIKVWGNDWIVLNIQQSGFYRVAYSQDLWLAIRDGLKENTNIIHLINRRILHEELNIGVAITNRLLASTILEFLTYMETEENYLVWNDANVNIAMLNRTLYGTEVYLNYMNLIAKLTRTHLMRIGYDTPYEESIEITQLRVRVKTLNCYALDEICLQHELDKLIKYFENKTENLPPDFCSAFRKANETIYVHYLNELTSNLQLANRNVIAATIHCTMKYSGLLTLAIEDDSNELSSSDRINIIRNLFYNEAALDEAIAYVERNLDKINSFILQIGSVVNSNTLFDKINKLIDQALCEGFLSESTAQSVKNTIQNNLLWQQKHFDSISNFFINIETTTSMPSSTNPITTTSIVETTTEDSKTLGSSSLNTSFMLLVISILANAIRNFNVFL